MIDQNTLYLGISLLILICINIVLGSVNGIFQQQFDKVKLGMGVVKGFVVSLCFYLILVVGQLNPNILLVQINDQNVSLSTATYLLMLSGYIYYGKECLIKLSGFVTGKYKINSVTSVINSNFVSGINSPNETSEGK